MTFFSPCNILFFLDSILLRMLVRTRSTYAEDLDKLVSTWTDIDCDTIRNAAKDCGDVPGGRLKVNSTRSHQSLLWHKILYQKLK